MPDTCATWLWGHGQNQPSAAFRNGAAKDGRLVLVDTAAKDPRHMPALRVLLLYRVAATLSRRSLSKTLIVSVKTACLEHVYSSACA